jgi:myo-inositol-1(or 4)-monophosphatase
LPASDLPLLIEAAEEAACIATRYIGAPMEVREKPDGAGPVTEADLAVDAALAQILRAARPDYGWLSEESADDAARLGAERVFIVDPIDGTRAFIDGNDIWAHSIAVAERGVITAAVIFLPMCDKLYSAAAGQGAALNQVPIRVTDRTGLDGASVLASRPALSPEAWRDGIVPRVTRAFRPSLACRLGLVAEGRYDAMLTLRASWEWDIAAGDLILREAGAVTSTRRAVPLVFNNPDPRLDGVIAANPALHGALHAALAD